MKKTIFLACIVLMQITACNDKDFFELKRPPQNPYNTLTELERAPIGAYAAIFAIGDWGSYYDIWQLYRTAVADDVAWSTPGDAAWGWYRDTENNKDWLDGTFSGAYVAISTINDALQFVEVEKGGDPYPDISSEDKINNLNRIVGDLHFLRGFIYYMNATLFCDAYVPGGPNDAKQIALRITRASSYEDASNPKIGTVQEIWDQIIADLQIAYELLPERYIDGMMHPSCQVRANKFAAAAMLARTHFAMGNYTQAKQYASFVIDQNGGDYDLSEEPIEAYNKSSLSRGKETIMYIPSYDETNGKQNLYGTCFNHLFLDSPCGWTATHMDYTVLTRIGWMDDPVNDTTINIAARRDKRFQQLMYVREPANVPESERVPGRYYEERTNLTYRTVVANRYYRGPKIGYTNLPQIRLAEMYLTRSIISFREGDKSGAASDLNVVRKRAWDENIAGEVYEASANFVTSANITEQMINDERLIEMFCEGDRIDYLRGLKADVPNGERGPGSVPYTDKGFVWPIPITEETLNNGYN